MDEEKTRLSATSYWAGGEQYVMESHLFYETALMTGAVFSSLLLIVAGFFYSQQVVMGVLVLVVLSFSLHGMLVKRWQHQHGSNKATVLS